MMIMLEKKVRSLLIASFISACAFAELADSNSRYAQEVDAYGETKDASDDIRDSSGDRTRSGQIGHQRGHIGNERGHIGEVRRHVTKRRNKMFDSEFLTPAGYSSSSPQSDDPEVDAQLQESTSWFQADAVGDSDHSPVYGNSSRARMYTNSTLIGLDLDNSFLQRMIIQTPPDITAATLLDMDTIRIIGCVLKEKLSDYTYVSNPALSEKMSIEAAAGNLHVEVDMLIADINRIREYETWQERSGAAVRGAGTLPVGTPGEMDPPPAPVDDVIAIHGAGTGERQFGVPIRKLFLRAQKQRLTPMQRLKLFTFQQLHDPNVALKNLMQLVVNTRTLADSDSVYDIWAQGGVALVVKGAPDSESWLDAAYATSTHPCMLQLLDGSESEKWGLHWVQLRLWNLLHLFREIVAASDQPGRLLKFIVDRASVYFMIQLRASRPHELAVYVLGRKSAEEFAAAAPRFCQKDDQTEGPEDIGADVYSAMCGTSGCLKTSVWLMFRVGGDCALVVLIDTATTPAKLVKWGPAEKFLARVVEG